MAREYFIRRRDIDPTGKPIVHSPDRSHHVPGDHMIMEKPISEQDIFDFGDEGIRHVTTHPKKRKKHSGIGHDSSSFRDDHYHKSLERAREQSLRYALEDALLGEEAFESALIDEEIAQEELDYIFDDEEAWVDWQNGERFDGSQQDYDATRTNSWEHSANREDIVLRRIQKMEQLFRDAQSYRRPQSTGRVQMTTGKTIKPVPKKTPKYLYKK